MPRTGTADRSTPTHDLSAKAAMKPHRDQLSGPAAARWKVLCGLALFLLAAAAEPLRREGESEPTDGGRGTTGVVWVVIDAAAAKYLGTMGREPSPTPRIDALAEEAVLFERAYAQAPVTPPSTASFLTGRQAPPAREDRFVLEESIQELLAEAGYRTAAFSENPYVSPRFGFDRGFAEFHHRPPRPGVFEGELEFVPRSGEIVSAALDWLGSAPERPFFLYLHLLPPHSPYSPPEPFLGRFSRGRRGAIDTPGELVQVDWGMLEASPRDLEILRSRYLDNLAWADHLVGLVFDGLEERGLLGRTLLVVSSDHGEAFGEHGRLLHGSTLYEEMIHVPLLLRFPAGLGPSARRYGPVVALVDVAPTLLDALGLEPPDGIVGRSVLPALAGGPPARRAALSRTAEAPGLVAAIEREWKLIVDEASGEVELYRLSRDPGEADDVAADHPGQVRRIWRHLEAPAGRSIAVEPVRIDDETRAGLEALGYLAPELGERPPPD